MNQSEQDQSDYHDGPCDYDGGYGEGGRKVLCTLCLDAIRASKREAQKETER